MSDDGAGRGEDTYRHVEGVYRHVAAARDALTVRRVFGEAYEADGATVIPVARVFGGSGTGAGRGDGAGSLRGDGAGTARGDGAGTARGESSRSTGGSDAGNGSGDGAGESGDRDASASTRADGSGREAAVSGGMGGFAVHARPAGVFVIRDGEVTWKPAWNLNAAILGGQVLSSVVALATAGVLRAYAKRRRRF